jgi:hypothetical protein
MYKKNILWTIWRTNTGRSFSELLILESTIPQYDKRLFIELQVQHMIIKSTKYVLYIICFGFDIQNILCTQHVLSLSFSCIELIIQ